MYFLIKLTSPVHYVIINHKVYLRCSVPDLYNTSITRLKSHLKKLTMMKIISLIVVLIKFHPLISRNRLPPLLIFL